MSNLDHSVTYETETLKGGDPPLNPERALQMVKGAYVNLSSLKDIPVTPAMKIAMHQLRIAIFDMGDRGFCEREDKR